MLPFLSEMRKAEQLFAEKPGKNSFILADFLREPIFSERKIIPTNLKKLNSNKLFYCVRDKMNENKKDL